MSLFKTLFGKPIECPPDLSPEEHAERFQSSSFLVKLWRCRHYIYIPFMIIYRWLFNKDMPFSFAVGISIGSAQGDMKWYFTDHEINNYLEVFLKSRPFPEENVICSNIVKDNLLKDPSHAELLINAIPELSEDKDDTMN